MVSCSIPILLHVVRALLLAHVFLASWFARYATIRGYYRKITGHPRFRSYNASQRVSSKINELFATSHAKVTDCASRKIDKECRNYFAAYLTHARAIKCSNRRSVVAFVAEPRRDHSACRLGFLALGTATKISLSEIESPERERGLEHQGCELRAAAVEPAESQVTGRRGICCEQVRGGVVLATSAWTPVTEVVSVTAPTWASGLRPKWSCGPIPHARDQPGEHKHRGRSTVRILMGEVAYRSDRRIELARRAHVGACVSRAKSSRQPCPHEHPHFAIEVSRRRRPLRGAVVWIAFVWVARSWHRLSKPAARSTDFKLIAVRRSAGGLQALVCARCT